jgi:hypothetical protein
MRDLTVRRLLPALAVATLVVPGAVPAGATTAPDASTCPTYNPPNELTLAGGTPQSAKLGTPFADPLQVALANSNGCPLTTPVAGIAITFAAPGSGPSGTFSSSGSNAALVGANATGAATAPQLTANRLPGGYTVVASSDYGSVGFSLVNTASGVPATIAASSSSQSAAVSARYAQPLQVRVLDATGAPVAGAAVTFVLGSGSSGAGSGPAGPGASFAGGQSQATATTDDSGTATSPVLTANSVAGKFTATAATAGITEPATVQLDNLAGRPPAVKPVGTARLSATVGSGYARRLEAKVTDASGRPLQGESVTFTLGASGSGASGGASGGASPGASFPGGSTQATETTGADGTAASPKILANATPGLFDATAAVAGITDPAEFSLRNLAGKPPKVHALGTPDRSAAVGSRYGSPLRVKVTAAAGKPLQGETVTFTLGTGGGGGAGGATGSAGATFATGSAQATETTDASGIATSPPFEADSTAGAFTATATVAGSNASASFQLVNLAGSGSLLRVMTHRLTATIGARYGPLEVKVLGPHGKSLQGQTVTFSLGSSTGGASGSAASGAGASFTGGSTQATATTDARGVAISPRPVANTTAGTFTATVSLTGSSATASVRLANRAGTPASVSAGAAASESTAIGSRFGVPLAVTVTDEHDNPVAGVLVTFEAPGHGAGGSFAGPHRHRTHRVRVRTNAAGIAVAPPFIANDTSGGYVVRAAVSDAPPAAFGLVNLPPGP